MGSHSSMSKTSNRHIEMDEIFHSVHGSNIHIKQSEKGWIARRHASFNEGIVFSKAPVPIHEFIQFRIVDTAAKWKKAMSFGFTSLDPTNYKAHGLPQYFLDNTNDSFNCVSSLSDCYNNKNTYVFFYVNPEGDIIFGVDGLVKGTFGKVQDVCKPLWAAFDVYGNTLAIEIRSYNQGFKNITSKLVNSSRLHEDQENISDCDEAIAIENRSPEALPISLPGSNNTGSWEEISDSTEEFAVDECPPTNIGLFLHEQEPSREDNSLSVSFVTSETGARLDSLLSPNTSDHNDGPRDSCQNLESRESTSAIRVSISDSEEEHTPGSSDSQQMKNEELPVTSNQRLSRTSASSCDNSDSSDECVICFERVVDCLLYDCGHMCLCYQCALLHFKRPEGGLCPFCRKAIKDVVKAYRC